MNIQRIIRGLACTLSLLLAISSIGCKLPVSLIDNESNGKATIHISIGQEQSGSRTIMPTMPHFSKYELSFSEKNNVATHVPVELLAKINAEIKLEPGEWTVLAKGYTMFNDKETLVAEGSSTFIVTPGQIIAQPIHMSALKVGADGVFVFSIQIPQGIPAQSYELSLAPYGSMDQPLTRTGALDTSFEAFTITERVSVAPGYYLATARAVYPDHVAIKREIIPIYSKKESTYNITYQLKDFMPVIELRGTLTVLENGTPQKDVSNYVIYAATDISTRDTTQKTMVGQAWTNSQGNWQITLEPRQNTQKIYFGVYDNRGNYIGKSQDAVLLSNIDVSNINITAATKTVTLSGTLSITKNKEIMPLNNYYVYAATLSDNGNYSQIGDQVQVNGGTDAWSLSIPSQDTSTDIYICVRDSSGNFNKVSSTSQSVSNSNINGINLSFVFNTLTLSGTAKVTINGEVQDLDNYRVYAHTDLQSYNGTSTIGHAVINPSEKSWTMEIEELSQNTTIYLTLSNDTSVRQMMWSEEVYQDAKSGIELNYAVTNIQLNGNLDITLDGNHLVIPQATIKAYTDIADSYESRIGRADANQDGNWTMSIPAFDQSTPVYFEVTGQFADGTQYTMNPDPIPVFKNSLSNLDFSFDLITLRGSVSIFTDEIPQDSANSTLTAFKNPDDLEGSYLDSTSVAEDGSWTMIIPAFAQETPVYFMVQSQTGLLRGQEARVHNTAVSGIELIWKTTVFTISGIVTGFNKAEMIYVVLDSTDFTTVKQKKHGMAKINPVDGSWTITCNSSMFEKAVTPTYFIIEDGKVMFITKSQIQVNSNGQSGITIAFFKTQIWNPKP